MSEAKERAPHKLSEASFNTLLAGAMGIPIAGLGIIIGLMSVMKEVGFNGGLIIAFTSLGFLLLPAAEILFIWLLIQNRTRAHKEAGANASIREAERKSLEEARAGELTGPVSSVTEASTRPIEFFLREPKSR